MTAGAGSSEPGPELQAKEGSELEVAEAFTLKSCPRWHSGTAAPRNLPSSATSWGSSVQCPGLSSKSQF